MRAERFVPFAVNWLWLQNSGADHRRFIRSLKNPGPVQDHYLKDLLQKNADTQYGRANHFSQISSRRDFEKNVPLTRYEDYLPYIEEISRGERRVLTHEKVTLFQPTSGTSSAYKLIPYNKSLKAEYQRAVAAWICHLYATIPSLMQGRAYWSISPAVEREKCHGCIPVGFDNDSEYLGIIGKRLYGMVSAGQTQFAPGISMYEFWDRTVINLLMARNLTLISVWSPTFLLAIIKHFTENSAKILDALMKSNLGHARERAEESALILQKQGINFEAIWPDLKLISCWTHGTSEPYAAEVRKYFPDVQIQGKGLVATEAFVSLPLAPDKDPVLAINSHFFEFQDVETNKIYLAHELRQAGVYSVIVTTGGGLYRYQLNDLVKVTGYIAATPTLRFIAKNDVSDLFGEKLNVEHVHRSVTAAFAECSLTPAFFLAAPVKPPNQNPSYALFFQSQTITDAEGRILQEKLESLLLENIHYAYCRRLGQLGYLKLFFIEGSPAAPEAVYMEEMYRRGQRPGDIKPPVMDREGGWERRFQGRFLDNEDSERI